MAIVFIGIGSNLGNRQNYIKQAIDFISSSPDIIFIKLSSIIETDPIGEISQQKFLNAVAQIQTNLEPLQLLEFLQGIEIKLGRVRLEKNGPRTIDLDILLYDELAVAKKNLIIPHPKMFERYFVLRPLIEICPEILNNKLVKMYSDKINKLISTV